MDTSREDKVDFPQPLVPHNNIVTDSFRSRILKNYVYFYSHNPADIKRVEQQVVIA